jgi:hypothetical protein
VILLAQDRVQWGTLVNELTCSINGGEFLEQLNDCKLFKNDCSIDLDS